MEFIPKNCLLDFNADQMKNVRKQYNLDKPGDMSGAIDVLEAWIKQQKHFKRKELPRSYLEKSLILNKGSLERVKSKLDKICTFRTMMPVFFGENLTMNKFEDIRLSALALLPKPTEDNYRVCLANFRQSTSLLSFYRYIILFCEYFLAYDYSNGVIIIIDYREANLVEIIKSINLMELRQFVMISTEGYAMRLQSINLLTTSKAVETLVAIFKQMVSPKLGKRIYVHRDINSIYQNIPKDLFPVDYGGKERPLVQLSDDIFKEITGPVFMNYIKEMNEAKTEESCRQTDTFNEKYLGMPGSFRTLNVD